jgi:hypothetical protein
MKRVLASLCLNGRIFNPVFGDGAAGTSCSGQHPVETRLKITVV